MAGTKPISSEDKGKYIVVEYHPKEFPVVVTKSAQNFISQQKTAGSDFKINPLIADQAGISKMQAVRLEEAIEAQALSRLKEVEERAYQEAFELGLSEGTQKAFDEHAEEFASRLQYLDSLFKSFENLKTRLVSENETQLVHLVVEIAKRIAMREIHENPDTIMGIIHKVVEDAQTDERLMVRISAEDLSFIESLKKEDVKEAEFLAKVRLEADPAVKSGGCVLETNYGSIDATIEQRVIKVWELLSHRTPKIEESNMGLSTTETSEKVEESVEAWASEIESLPTEEPTSSEEKSAEEKSDEEKSEPDEGGEGDPS